MGGASSATHPRSGLVSGQAALSCMASDKEAYLYMLLRQRPGRVIVFCNAISCLRRLRALLERMQAHGAAPAALPTALPTLAALAALALRPRPLQVHVIALQGDMQQRARLKAVDRFVAAPRCVLLATDVAARGLDFPAVDYVVHFQLPRSSETYVHRSGRTARAAASGLSVCLVEPTEQRAYRKLCHDLGEAEGLAELELDMRQLARHREVAQLALQAFCASPHEPR